MKPKNTKNKLSSEDYRAKLDTVNKLLHEHFGKTFHLEGRYDAAQDVLYANEERHDITVRVIRKDQPVDDKKYQVLVGIDSLPAADRQKYYQHMNAYFSENENSEMLEDVFIRHAGRRIPFHRFMAGQLGGNDLNLGGFITRLADLKQKVAAGIHDVHLRETILALKIPRFATVAPATDVQKTFAFLALMIGGAWVIDRFSFMVLDKTRYNRGDFSSQGIPVHFYNITYGDHVGVDKWTEDREVVLPTMDEITAAFGDIRNPVFPIGVLRDINKVYGELLAIYSKVLNVSREEVRKMLPSQGLLELAAQQRLSK